ncbi:pimeloyl-ACP methyl ester carboxylesterase [Phycicoccus badiiscoriae]|uniref:Pimeloyl-ACP methyl ester carboxylesterase n=1 Tax=Pedococcus badiiscoriae TaxID=642776 RepID=A0A852WM27_9MICO|nr:alpha/beta hydrolase [Pedococcus badiiscoriae]NYG08641.1 pimeloyl-ACP methyl ester carboxylesterase [Pedococcus badiiscoriae]
MTVTTTSPTRFATSADGTVIAYDVTGTGPAVVVVEGALCQRTMGTAKELVPLLSEHHTVFAYDRRGRGESGPGSSSYAVEREVEDLLAVLEVAGPDAFVVGASSGAVLVLEALRAGARVRRAALYEAPLIVDDTHVPNDPDLGRRTQQLVSAGRRGEAVKLFLRTVGVPAAGLVVMRMMPVWKKLCGLAHTLPHDYAIVLPHQQGQPLPAGHLSGITVPVLVIVGGKSPTYLKNAQAAVAAALPNGTLRELPGQTHMVRGRATVPALRDFWAG